MYYNMIKINLVLKNIVEGGGVLTMTHLVSKPFEPDRVLMLLKSVVIVDTPFV